MINLLHLGSTIHNQVEDNKIQNMYVIHLSKTTMSIAAYHMYKLRRKEKKTAEVMRIYKSCTNQTKRLLV